MALAMPAAAPAGGVADVISDLYGGDGITLDPSASFVAQFHDAHFTQESQTALNDLSTAIAGGAGIVALNSASTSFTFDLKQGVPVRTTESLGPLLTERASTIGASKLNVGFAFSRADFKRFEGDDLDDLQLIFRHDDVPDPGPVDSSTFEDDFIVVDIDLELEQNIFAFFGTYGITDNWDVGAVVPLIYVDSKADARATVIHDPNMDGFPESSLIHEFGGIGDPATDTVEEDAFGIGDIVVRTKYDMSDMIGSDDSEWMPNFGVLGQVSLGTGDEDDLLGLGETTFLGLLIASKQIDWFGPHVNVGYEVATGNSDELNNLRYAAGFDARILPELTGIVDVIGRWYPDGNGVRDVVDIAIGAKWDPFDRVPIQANLLIPLNKDTGLRADDIWSIGFDITF
jgi:hypothetical protein